jgi:hypothetical protein
MSEPGRGLYSRAEDVSRAITLTVGVGVGAAILGTLVSAKLLGLVESDLQATPLTTMLVWLNSRLWVLLLLPAFGWLTGRFGATGPLTFGVVGALSGELFSFALATAGSELEWVIGSSSELVARLLSWVAGLALTVFAASRGRAARARADARAQAFAQAQRAEYDAFVARATEGSAEAPKPPDAAP